MKIKPHSMQVRALLNSAYPMAVKGNDVIIGCEAEFHRDKLSDEARAALIENVMAQVMGTSVRLEFVVDQNVREAMQAASASESQSKDLFDQQESTEDVRKELLNHPVVKALQERGGEVARVSVNDE
jgi:chromosomal replication initiation ATPase DnaA